MGLFSFAKNLFKKEPASEYIQVQSFLSSIDQLLGQDRYLARSDYQHLPDDYSSEYELYDSSRKSNSLSYLIKKQRANKETVDEFLKLYEQIKDLSKQPYKIRKHKAGSVVVMYSLFCEQDRSVLLAQKYRASVSLAIKYIHEDSDKLC